jgi:hypothetical protein
MIRWQAQFRRFRFAGVAAIGMLISPSLLRAQDSDYSNEYHVSVLPYFLIYGALAGYGEFGYAYDPDMKYQRFIAEWPNLNYKAARWLQLCVGLRTQYKDNQTSANTITLRPYIGPKLFVPNSWKWDIYNYTRYEFPDTLNEGTHQWSGYSRLRSRFGVQFPIACLDRAWQPKTWYGLADVEPFYRIDQNTITAVHFRAGGGYIVNDRLRVEFIYTAELNRQNGSSLEFNQSSFQVTVRIGLSKGIIQRVLDNFGGR